MNITELIGKRALITESDRFSSKKATEVKFLEVSPSGNWVKLMNMHGNKYWKPVQELSLIEALIDIEKPPKEE
jgi:hypothetical protein